MSIAQVVEVCQSRQLDLFLSHVPARPYCSDNLDAGLVIRGKLEALKQRYIQANGPTHLYTMPFDVDRASASYDWDDRHAPPPNIVVTNRANGHAHLLYILAVPVRKAPDAQLKPLRFAAAVEYGIREKLDADYGYAGLIIKNPMHNDWQVQCFQEDAYSLGWLSDYINLRRLDYRKRPADYGLGRNVTVFNSLRHWAYKARFSWPWQEYEQWRLACFERAVSYNSFLAPLPITELRAITKSVAKWVWTKYDGRMSDEAFSRIQSARGTRGGLKSGIVRAEKACEKTQLIMNFEGLPVAQIVAETGLPRRTVYRLRAQVKNSEASTASE